jgi:zinc protease
MSSMTLPGPETITRCVLANGTVVLARENFTSPAVVIRGLVRAGSVDEAAEKAGLAAFTAAMLMRGTETRAFHEINETIESVGASLGFHGGLHTTRFGAKCLAEDLPLIGDVLADVLQHSVFPAPEVEKVRGEFITGLQQRDENTRAMADLTFRAMAYPNGHPYGRSDDGYQETIRSISQDDLATFYARTYRPADLIVAVVGAIKADQAVELVERMLGRWQSLPPRPEQLIPQAPRLDSVRRKSVPMAGKTQSDIVLGCPGIPRRHPDYFAANLANLVLGGFGMMGRLGDNVRDEQGLAYYVYSRLEAGLGAGPWMAVAGVNPKNADQAIDSILAEIQRLRDSLVEPQELSDSKAYLTGSLPLRLETNEGVAGVMLEMELHNLGLDYLQRYPALIEAVTPEEVQAAARKYLNPEAYALAIAGPSALER